MWNIWGKSDVFSLLKSPDAKRVMEHNPHLLDKHYIDVSWLEEEESGSTEEAGNVVDRESATRIPEPERTLTISVSGFSSSTTEATVREYFKNKRSGGGEIKELNYSTEERVAEITFLQVTGLCCCISQLRALYISNLSYYTMILNSCHFPVCSIYLCKYISRDYDTESCLIRLGILRISFIFSSLKDEKE